MHMSETNIVTKEDVLDSFFVNEQDNIRKKKQKAKVIVLIGMKLDVLGL